MPFVVPCHRVVKSDWSLGEYSAGGREVKEQVLRMEGVSAQRLAWLQRQPRFIGTQNIVCLPVCPGLDLVDPAELHGFDRIEDALNTGYQPCDHCRPL